jgi:hypothetical protein
MKEYEYEDASKRIAESKARPLRSFVLIRALHPEE